MPNLIDDVSKILNIMIHWTENLETFSNGPSDADKVDNPLSLLVYQVHKFNFLLWNNEDEARRSDVDDATQVKVKRESHRLNQARNDAIEKVDEWLLEHAYDHLTKMNLPMRTETPGSVFDRLSILSLKIYHMDEQTKRVDVSEDHKNVCRQKLQVLYTQKVDLEKSLLEMFDDLESGKIKMKIYRQFKMYNDPAFNPKLYSNKI